MILIIDNYDSFVYNLARYVAKSGMDYRVVRNDKITLSEIKDYKPEAIIISPGPCTPQKAGISIDVIKEFGAHTPILGVCLGHQAIGEAYGGQTIRAEKPVHGKSSDITHEQDGIFKGLNSPLKTGRYHSLISDLAHAADLKITAYSESGEIMAVEHDKFPVYGVQFHPESVLTPHGQEMIENFLTLAQDWNKTGVKNK